MKEEDEIIIRTNGVKVNFGDFWALKGIDMEVRKGEIIVVLSSGSLRLRTACHAYATHHWLEHHSLSASYSVSLFSHIHQERERESMPLQCPALTLHLV